MTDRDPRIDPHEGDVLYEYQGTAELHVDTVTDEWVYYRVTDGHCGLMRALRLRVHDWKTVAPHRVQWKRHDA